MRQKYPFLPILCNIILEFLATYIREGKEVKEKNSSWKQVKHSLFADDMVLYIENPKDAIRKLLRLINGFGKVAGYKINIQKSLVFIYTNNERAEREIKETISFNIATTTTTKYLEINLPKQAKSL